MDLALVIILLILNLLNVFLHSIGACLLIHLYKRSRQKAQQLYLIHLSISECLMNLLESIRSITKFTHLDGNMSHIVDRFLYYTLILSFTGVSFVFYLVMVYVTIDRLMVIALNLQYTKYWNENKAKYLLLVTWLIGGVIAITVEITYVVIGFEWETIFFKYFYPTMEFLFILLAFLTYIFIICKYRKRQRTICFHSEGPLASSTQVVSLKKKCKSSKHSVSNTPIAKRIEFRKSIFYIPLLLITTFLIFMIIPDLTYLVVAVINNNPSQTLSTICWISYAVSNLLDAWIYIYLQHHIRNFIKRKFEELFS